MAHLQSLGAQGREEDRYVQRTPYWRGRDLPSRKGHNYITQFVDLDTRKTIFVTEWQGCWHLRGIQQGFAERQGKVDNIKTVGYGHVQVFHIRAMSHSPKASIIFDSSISARLLNEALKHKGDQVQRASFTLLYNKEKPSPQEEDGAETILMTLPDYRQGVRFQVSPCFDIFNECTKILWKDWGVVRHGGAGGHQAYG